MKDFSIPNGIYGLKIIDIEEKKSKSGKDMYVLTYLATDINNNSYTINDFVVKSLDWKIEQIQNAFNATMDNLLGSESSAIIEVQEYTNADHEVVLTSKVKKFVKAKLPSAKPNQSFDVGSTELNDDIPF